MNTRKTSKLLQPASTTRKLLVFAVLCASSRLEGQTTASAPTDTAPPTSTTTPVERDKDVVTLSPFVVTADDSSGYVAGSTLAGTRLKSQLRDVGASVSVVTKDFLNDIGINDMDLLVYTGGTEATGANGNYLGANTTENAGNAREERTNARPQENYRIRGLARADTTQNFFISKSIMDGFNVERVTINRGPNSALFGLGSPGGIVDSSLKRAAMRDFGSFEARWDEFGSQRYVADYNEEVIKDRFAIRVIGLWERNKYEQKQAFENDRRVHLDINIVPFKNANLRAFYTRGEINAARPELLPARDQIWAWTGLGKPLWDPFTSQYYRTLEDFNAGRPVDNATRTLWNTYAFQNNFAVAQNNKVTAIFTDPTSRTMGGNGMPEAATWRIERGTNYVNYPAAPYTNPTMWMQPRFTRDLYRAPIGSGIPLAAGLTTAQQAFYYDQRLNNTDFFDYREQTAWGPNKFEFGEMETYSVSFEQTFLDNQLGFEAAMYHETYNDNFRRWGQEITVDMNIRLPDGTMNPMLGRAFVYGDGFAEPQFNEQDAMRVTAFGQYDFAQNKKDSFLQHLGRQVLTLFAGQQKSDFRRETHMPGISFPDAGEYRTGVYDQVIGGANRLAVISYLGGESLLNMQDTSSANLRAPTVRQIPTTTTRGMIWDSAQAATILTGPGGGLAPGRNLWEGVRTDARIRMVDHAEDPASTFTWGNSRQESEVNSFATILQSFWLNKHLVTTASWRKDDVQLRRAADGPRDPVSNLNIRDIWPTTTKVTEDPLSITQTSFSVVAHSPDFINRYLPWGTNISLHYTKSENVDAQGGFINWYNESIALSSGETQEYGFSVRTLENKLEFKATWFDSDSKGAILNPISRINNIENDILRFNTEAELQAVDFVRIDPEFITANEIAPNGNTQQTDTGVTVIDYTSRNPQQSSLRSTADVVSKGMEFELTYNPTKNWRMTLNVAQQEAIKDNIDPALKRYWTERLEYFRSVGSSIWMSTNRVIETLPGSPEEKNSRLFNSDTGQFHVNVANELATYYSAISQEGQPAQELREWRANFITNYNFRDFGPEFLRAFGIGGAIRWQDNIALGNPIIPSPDVAGTWIPDLDNPYFGSEEWNMDLWVTYSRKFSDKLAMRARFGVRNAMGGGGMTPVNANPDGAINTWRIAAPTTLEFSTAFEF
jgi:outer membrane receptor protein involved in Fe transport